MEEKQGNRVDLEELASQNDGGRVTAAWVALLPSQPLCREQGVAELHFLFFSFSYIFISWRLITLQYCSGFCHTLT